MVHCERDQKERKLNSNAVWYFAHKRYIIIVGIQIRIRMSNNNFNFGFLWSWDRNITYDSKCNFYLKWQTSSNFHDYHVIEFSYMVHSFYFSRVSIIRGRVVTLSGQGIIGVRVSVDRTKDSTNYGFTLTRPGGW